MPNGKTSKKLLKARLERMKSGVFLCYFNFCLNLMLESAKLICLRPEYVDNDSSFHMYIISVFQSGFFLFSSFFLVVFLLSADVLNSISIRVC
jgi:hypothetical protein